MTIRCLTLTQLYVMSLWHAAVIIALALIGHSRALRLIYWFANDGRITS